MIFVFVIVSQMRYAETDYYAVDLEWTFHKIIYNVNTLNEDVDTDILQ